MVALTMAQKRNLFKKTKNKRIADAIDITSPHAFKRSIRTLKKRGLTLQEQRALVLARGRAKLQLRRKNLSMKERRQFSQIAKTEIPRIKR